MTGRRTINQKKSKIAKRTFVKSTFVPVVVDELVELWNKDGTQVALIEQLKKENLALKTHLANAVWNAATYDEDLKEAHLEIEEKKVKIDALEDAKIDLEDRLLEARDVIFQLKFPQIALMDLQARRRAEE